MRAIPGAGSRVPLWILGSSLFGAQLAAMLGLPYAFASHFAPEALLPALDVYRSSFQPSEQLQQPHTMVGANVIAADDDDTARRLFTSAQQSFTNILRGRRGRLPPPIDDIELYWSPPEKERASAMLRRSFVGSPETVGAGLERFAAETNADELIVAGAIHDQPRVCAPTSSSGSSEPDPRPETRKTRRAGLSVAPRRASGSSTSELPRRWRWRATQTRRSQWQSGKILRSNESRRSLLGRVAGRHSPAQ